MASSTYRFSPERSSVTVVTHAEGLLARLAHDLEIAALPGEGTASKTDTWNVHFDVGSQNVEIRGAVRHGVVDPTVLSAGDVQEITRRTQELFFPKGASLRIDGTMEGSEAIVRVAGPSGPASFRCVPRIVEGSDGITAEGRLEVSLAKLGIPPIKGPMGAFRIRDTLQVNFRLHFQPGE